MAHPVLTKEFYSQPQQRPCCVTWSVTYTASPYPTLSASAKPIFEMGCTEITCGQSHTTDFKSSVIKGLIKIGMDEDEKLAVNFAWP